MNTSNFLIANAEKCTIKDQQFIIAGPCSFSSYEELYEIALELKKLGVEYLRAGCFKPRTSPYSFQGLADEGIEYLIKIKQLTGLKIVTELMDWEQVQKYKDDIDVIQIGSRNMYNYDLLSKLGTISNTILLKRGFSATIEEWLSAAEYIAKNGNQNIILCERGIRGFDTETRNVLDLQAVAVVKKLCALPVIVDPSHASGRADIIEPMSLAAMISGADGLEIEAHTNPKISPSDANQTITIDELNSLLTKLKSYNFI